jgi:hypothetical protein
VICGVRVIEASVVEFILGGIWLGDIEPACIHAAYTGAMAGKNRTNAPAYATALEHILDPTTSDFDDAWVGMEPTFQMSGHGTCASHSHEPAKRTKQHQSERKTRKRES